MLTLSLQARVLSVDNIEQPPLVVQLEGVLREEDGEGAPVDVPARVVVLTLLERQRGSGKQ